LNLIKKKTKVFLVGVGGIGVSSLAKFLHKNNFEIFGSSDEKNENISELQEKFGLKFLGQHSSKNLTSDFEFLIYSPAIPENNPERLEAKRQNIPEYSYPEYLGKISENKFTVSIAGTNGKTTTTTMVAELVEFFQYDTSVVMGGISKKFNSNFLSGTSDNFIVESCEFKNSFLNIFPNIIAITNLTPDHLDFFGNFNNYKNTFIKFLDNFKSSEKNKVLICDKNNTELKEVIDAATILNIKIIDYQKYNIEKVSIPGEYNRENARVALAIIDLFGLDVEMAKKYLANEFIGSKRRFNLIGKTIDGAIIYDDYAHNPEALIVLKDGLDEKFPKKKKILIFQPHLFSRTESFFKGFVESIATYDFVFLLPIYKAREEEKDFSITSEKLFLEIKNKNKNTNFFNNFSECVEEITKKKYNKDFVIITVGAGDVYKIGLELVK
jgi:UDP-N-acetylmuramate--alanine ligase